MTTYHALSVHDDLDKLVDFEYSYEFGHISEIKRSKLNGICTGDKQLHICLCHK